MKQGDLEAAIEELFHLSANGAVTTRSNELVDSICRRYALDGDDRNLVETFIREATGQQLPAVPTMDNASLYKAPPDILSA